MQFRAKYGINQLLSKHFFFISISTFSFKLDFKVNVFCAWKLMNPTLLNTILHLIDIYRRVKCVFHILMVYHSKVNNKNTLSEYRFYIWQVLRFILLVSNRTFLAVLESIPRSQKKLQQTENLGAI